MSEFRIDAVLHRPRGTSGGLFQRGGSREAFETWMRNRIRSGELTHVDYIDHRGKKIGGIRGDAR